MRILWFLMVHVSIQGLCCFSTEVKPVINCHDLGIITGKLPSHTPPSSPLTVNKRRSDILDKAVKENDSIRKLFAYQPGARRYLIRLDSKGIEVIAEANAKPANVPLTSFLAFRDAARRIKEANLVIASRTDNKDNP